MRAQRYRVLLCGTNYGRVYLDPIERDPGSELAGILARGSSRSQDLARALGVPLYSQISQLPPEIDLACAALGSSAFDIVEGLLEKGIHVLCEHPLKLCHLQRGHAAAQAARVCFHVNAHFGDLEALQAFGSECRRLLEKEKPTFLSAVLSDRMLYGFFDFLCRSLGSLQPLRLEKTAELQSFAVLSGRLAGMDSVIQIQQAGGSGRRSLRDGSPHYWVDLTAEIGFPSGTLHLIGLPGPVLWNRNLNRQSDRENCLWEPVYSQADRTRRDLDDDRNRANCRALAALLAEIEGQRFAQEQHPEHLEKVVTAWEMVGRMLAPDSSGAA